MQPESNWLGKYYPYSEQFLYHRYDRYSKEDVVKFREKLDLLTAAKFSDEWEGDFYRGTGDAVGFSSFRMDFNAGFVDFYVYTCLPELRYINYGKASNSPEFIQLTPEFAIDSPRKESPVRYVKIKWNDRYYLVEESSLPAFAKKIVGVFVEPEDTQDDAYQKWSNYWVKGDTEKELTGLPEFPAGYRKFQRFPIETKILTVGKRTIETEVETARWMSSDETAVYKVTIGAGADQGVIKKMIFEVPEIGEQILITQVNPKNSVGIIARTLDESKNDTCYKDEYNVTETPCLKIKPALKTRTQIGKF